MTDEKTLEEGIAASEKFFGELTTYLGLPNNKDAETVVGAAFGAVEFACVIGFQAQIPEEDFINTVKAIWEGVHARHAVSDEKPSEEDSASEGQPSA